MKFHKLGQILKNDGFKKGEFLKKIMSRRTRRRALRRNRTHRRQKLFVKGQKS